MTAFATKAIHGENLRPDAHGALRPPLFDGVAFEFPDADSIRLAFEGRKPSHAYTRISNPTVDEFERRVRLLADAFAVVAVSSGMAAISNVLMTLAEAGSNIVTTNWIFGNTYSLFEDTFKPWGLETRYVNMAKPEEIAAAIDDKTRAIFLEVITNPQMQVADIAAITKVAHARGVPVVLDGTVTTPYLFRSKDYGVDVEVISSTKYISGGATTMGGLILDNGIFDWKQTPRLATAARKFGPGALVATLRREVFRNTGACLAPHNAFLQTLGLETLPLRIDRSTANALEVAQWLSHQPQVKQVNYPGLPSSPAYELAKKQFPKGVGGILTFDLQDRAAAFALQNALNLIRRATNINDNKSLILHPASTIFCDYNAEEKQAMGVSEAMLRLSVGIEDAADLITDLQQGLAVL
ncbi:O-acetylhomoserine aminocarboxypropyltransferase/cysteine synthase family protein [Telmatobacter bradus]|uniref:O-acetylhomoserine aminocarboxypropyltransferase/cysteine synthase family protein n=1 Tax=Telmatobacter bradus TaxID=474953 RepID=UPI003B4353AC